MWTPEQEECYIYPEEPEPIIDFDAVFIPDVFQRVAMIAPQLVYHDIVDVRLMGTSLWQSPKLIELAGDYVQDALFPSGFFVDSVGPQMEGFVATYKHYFDGEPGVLAATGYDTVRMVGRVLDLEACRSRRDFRRILRSYLVHEGVTGLIAFGSNGEVIKKPTLLTVSGKKMRRFQPRGDIPILQ
jgi:ABC-type branched-subunit amino acid transport system substrate-binding protein